MALDMGMAPGHRPYRRLWREGGPSPGTPLNLHRLQRYEYSVDRGRQKAKLYASASFTVIVLAESRAVRNGETTPYRG
jgi:hypothetical protein